MTAPRVNVALVACGKSKMDRPAPARRLYTGNLFRAASEFAEATCDEWYVISALHGLLHPDDVIAPYDRSMSQLDRDQRRQWASLLDIDLRCGRSPRHPGRVDCDVDGPRLGHLVADGVEVRVFVYAGAHYANPIRELLAARHRPWAQFYFPMAHLQIGEQLAYYAEDRRRRADEALS